MTTLRTAVAIPARSRWDRAAPAWLREIALYAGVCGVVVASTLSALGRSLPVVSAATAAAVAIPAGLLVASRAVLGREASIAAPAAAAVLTTLGIVTAERLDAGEWAGQTTAAVLGAVGFVLAGVVTARQRGHRPGWTVAALSGVATVLLSLPFVPGLARPTASGVDLAFAVAGVSVQPAEFARPLVVVATAIGIAGAAPRLRYTRRRIAGMLAVTAPLAAPVGLLAIARDFGPILVLGCAAVIMVVLARPAWPIVAAVIVLPVLLGVAAALTVPTIRGRLAAVVDPVTADGELTHVGFGLRAVARGGWWGTGPGLGDPAAVRYAESDFVLAAVAEERGVLTVVLVIGLFVVLSRALWASAGRAGGEPAQLYAAGLVAMVVVQAAYTTFGVLGVVPLTGMAVPFVSLGGSALLAMWIILGGVVGAGASVSWPAYGVPHGFPVACRASTATLLAGALLAVSVVVAPPVPAGRSATVDWASRRGLVLAADGTVLAGTAEGGRGSDREYPHGALYAGAVGFTRPGAGAGLEVSARDRHSCRDTLWQGAAGMRCSPPALVTTLVPAVQREAAAALTGVTGDVVALDVATGGVLAAYSTGTTDPALPTGSDVGGRAEGGGRAAAYADLVTSPGSVFKLVVAAAVLRAGVASDTARARQFVPRGGASTVRNAGDGVGGGSLEEALASSSNTAFAELATRVGEDAVTRAAEELLNWPPAPEGPAAAAATAGPGPLGPDELARTGFGQQGVRAAPLALAVLAAEIGSGGVQQVPRLVAGTCSSGEFVADAVPEPVRVLNEEVARQLGAAMERSVREGRAPALEGLGVPVAAKTGTAERPDGLDDGLIVAYAPADRPAVAVAVRVEADPVGDTSRSGGVDAAGVAAAVLRTALSDPVAGPPTC